MAAYQAVSADDVDGGFAQRPIAPRALRFLPNRRLLRFTGAFTAVVLVILLAVLTLAPTSFSLENIKNIDGSALLGNHGEIAESDRIADFNSTTTKLHILLPASNKDVNLCKTLLSLSVLGYPTPTIVAWNEEYNDPTLLGGGSHLAKISRVMEYLEALGPEHDGDLVMMLDAYDIWFQLPLEVLLSRYHRLNREANAQLERRLGKAAKAEDIKQTIIFASGKRCAPNQPHTIACYPMPDSPIPMNVYGENTDTQYGRNGHYSKRQRYLNSGYIIGPAKDVRALFARASQKVQETKDIDLNDNGSHGSDMTYHGSDQSIFSTILGEQEYQREIIRRRHLSWFDRVRHRIFGDTYGGTTIDRRRYPDILNLPFTHQHMDEYPGKPFEFGIGLDYLSDLGHQTVNSEEDTRSLLYNEELQPQVNGQSEFDCHVNLPTSLPPDILSSPFPYSAYDKFLNEPPWPMTVNWTDVPLYTNICLGTIPVIIHMNGWKEAREVNWERLWWTKYARLMLEARQKLAAEGGAPRVMSLEEHRENPGRIGAGQAGGAWTDKDTGILKWEQLCPVEFEGELFRGG